MLYTIGHSNHDADTFVALLHQYAITALADVRSHPVSRFVPHFSHRPLKALLAEAGVAHVFLGRELGARSDNPDCYRNGQVQFDLLAREPAFARGIRRVEEGAREHRIALMCAEKDPADCHRALLVTRELAARGHGVAHIHADDSLETNRAFEDRLLRLCGLPETDMFRDRGELVAQAYSQRAGAIAWRKPGAQPKSP